MIKKTVSENVSGLTSDVENCVSNPETIEIERRYIHIDLSYGNQALDVIETIYERSELDEDEIILAMLDKFSQELLSDPNHFQKFMEERIWD